MCASPIVNIAQNLAAYNDLDNTFPAQASRHEDVVLTVFYWSVISLVITLAHIRQLSGIVGVMKNE
jgi:hypothetical protein